MRRLSLVNSPYHHYIEEDENFRRWVEALERMRHGYAQAAEKHLVTVAQPTIDRGRS